MDSLERKRFRNTSAHAEKTQRVHLATKFLQKHLRSRGENPVKVLDGPELAETPPLTRRKHQDFVITLLATHKI